MKSLASLFLVALGLCVPASSQDNSSKESDPVVETAARILGRVPDGTPPPPEAPKPEFIVPARDVLESKAIEQGGRTITIREIKPIDLPELPPEPLPPTPDPNFQARLGAYRSTHPETDYSFLSAAVYRSKNTPPRTLVHWWPQHGGEAIDFWSSADFALIAGGIQSFIDTAGNTQSMFISWGNVEIDKMSARQTANAAPTIPDFPAGKATFTFITKAPAAEDLLVLQSLHDLYNCEYARLRAAYNGREQACLAQEAELKAHPPQPKDITLNHWRIESPITNEKGGDQ